ncbi:hypothetical protein PoB_001092200 [Plakobranchus ocellatus]|uniref:Uncharacterized protein n=1 Tax=Plakobranchus ocellatus TaxID=259542 RepID=A0AAV3YPQ4_9GAST|nr:hypothetical protein PoB_001092200 [Plakobranchus ocellatus]
MIETFFRFKGKFPKRQEPYLLRTSDYRSLFVLSSENRWRLPGVSPSGISQWRPSGQRLSSCARLVTSESALRSAGTILLRVRAPLPASWPGIGPKSLLFPVIEHLRLQTFSINSLA